MSNYYGATRYGAPRYSHSRHEDMQYPGYDDTWILGHQRGSSWGDDHHHMSHSSSYNPRSLRSLSYPRGRSASRLYPSHGYDRPVHLAWPTEIPLQMRVSLCCEECKMRLDDELRDIQGVHDVSISGYANALVTVTGTAAASKILSKARKISTTAELWSNESYY